MQENDVITRQSLTEFIDTVSGQLVIISNHLDSAILDSDAENDNMLIMERNKVTTVFASLQVLCNNMRQIVGLESIGEAEQDSQDE
jgi:hypothetical protein